MPLQLSRIPIKTGGPIGRAAARGRGGGGAKQAKDLSASFYEQMRQIGADASERIFEKATDYAQEAMDNYAADQERGYPGLGKPPRKEQPREDGTMQAVPNEWDMERAFSDYEGNVPGLHPLILGAIRASSKLPAKRPVPPGPSSAQRLQRRRAAGVAGRQVGRYSYENVMRSGGRAYQAKKAYVPSPPPDYLPPRSPQQARGARMLPNINQLIQQVRQTPITPGPVPYTRSGIWGRLFGRR